MVARFREHCIQHACFYHAALEWTLTLQALLQVRASHAHPHATVVLGAASHGRVSAVSIHTALAGDGCTVDIFRIRAAALVIMPHVYVQPGHAVGVAAHQICKAKPVIHLIIKQDGASRQNDYQI
jgi:hypothetical protein